MKEHCYFIKNSQLRVVLGSILETSADVIVSSDDCRLSMGGGVSRSISRGAGESILLDRQKFVPAKLGDVVVTSAGELPNKYVFHVVTIGAHSFEQVEKNINLNQFVLENSVNKCFRLLSSLELNSIAFPTIGAGVAKIPYKEVALYMISTIIANLLRTNKALKVELYLYDRWHKMTEWDFVMFFEAIGKYLPNENLEVEENNSELNIQKTETPFIFVSYSRKDFETAREICSLLVKHNFDYWIDEVGKYSGSNFKGVIVNQIKKSTMVLFLSSENSNKSPNVVKEIGLAVKNDKPIIPIKIDSTSYDENIEYDLCSIDYIEYDKTPEFEKRLMDNISMYFQR